MANLYLQQVTNGHPGPNQATSTTLGNTTTTVPYSMMNYTTFYRRAQWNHTTEVLRWLQTYPDLIHTADETGHTALHWAAEYNHSAETVQLLLSHGANPNVQNLLGVTPLHLAIKKKKLEIVKILVSAQANFNLPDHSSKTPFHTAVDLGFEAAIQYLLNYEININSQDQYGNTPLHTAMMVTAWLDSQSANRIIALLLNKGAATTIPNYFNYTPDANAEFIKEKFVVPTASFQHQNDIHYPIAPQLSRDHAGCTPFHRRAQWEQTQAVLDWIQAYPNHRLVDERDDVGNTPLHISAQYNQSSETIRRLLLEGKADVNAQNHAGQTPLHLAIQRGKRDLVITLLANANINCNLVDQNGRTPFYEAVRFNQPVIVALLTSPDASIAALSIDLHKPDQLGNTPLHEALASTQWDTQYKPLIQLLLDKGANPDVRNKNGQTPEEYAQQLAQVYSIRPNIA